MKDNINAKQVHDILINHVVSTGTPLNVCTSELLNNIVGANITPVIGEVFDMLTDELVVSIRSVDLDDDPTKDSKVCKLSIFQLDSVGYARMDEFRHFETYPTTTNALDYLKHTKDYLRHLERYAKAVYVGGDKDAVDEVAKIFDNSICMPIDK